MSALRQALIVDLGAALHEMVCKAFIGALVALLAFVALSMFIMFVTTVGQVFVAVHG